MPKSTDLPSVFSVKDYRAFIRADIASHKAERGYQKKLAEAAGCRPSYLSQVLNSHIQLTMDQGALLCEFWEFNEDRTELFLALLQQERSSSKVLKEFLQKRITSLRRKHLQVSSRISADEKIVTRDDRLAYYSNWIYPSIHVLGSITEFQNFEKLSQRLNLPKQVLLNVIDQLVQMGFIRNENGRISSLISNIHVHRDSPLNISNHFQWRHRSLNRLIEDDSRSTHYTALYAISRSDIEVLRETLLEFIEKTRKIASSSKEEDAVCLLTDLFYI